MEESRPEDSCSLMRGKNSVEQQLKKRFSQRKLDAATICILKLETSNSNHAKVLLGLNFATGNQHPE